MTSVHKSIRSIVVVAICAAAFAAAWVVPHRSAGTQSPLAGGALSDPSSHLQAATDKRGPASPLKSGVTDSSAAPEGSLHDAGLTNTPVTAGCAVQDSGCSATTPRGALGANSENSPHAELRSVVSPQSAPSSVSEVPAGGTPHGGVYDSSRLNDSFKSRVRGRQGPERAEVSPERALDASEVAAYREAKLAGYLASVSVASPGVSHTADGPVEDRNDGAVQGKHLDPYREIDEQAAGLASLGEAAYPDGDRRMSNPPSYLDKVEHLRPR